MFGLHPIAAAPFADVGVTSAQGGANNYSITAESGSFSITGQTVDFLKAINTTADSGSFSLTGQDITTNIRQNQVVNVSVDAGSFALTGNEIDFGIGESFQAGSFALTGQAVNAVKSVQLSVDLATFSATVFDVDLVADVNRERFESENYAQQTITIGANSAVVYSNDFNNAIVEPVYDRAA